MQTENVINFFLFVYLFMYGCEIYHMYVYMYCTYSLLLRKRLLSSLGVGLTGFPVGAESGAFRSGSVPASLLLGQPGRLGASKPQSSSNFGHTIQEGVHAPPSTRLRFLFTRTGMPLHPLLVHPPLSFSPLLHHQLARCSASLSPRLLFLS